MKSILDHRQGGLTPDDMLSLFDGALDAIIMIDTASKIIGWNRSAEQTFGYSRNEAMGRDLVELVIPGHLRSAHHAGMDRYLDTGEGRVLNTRIEVTALNRAGREFPVELTVVPISHPEGLRFCAFLRNISERVEAEQKLARRALESQVLYEVTALLAQGGSTDESLRICLQKICELSSWSAGHSYLPDDVANPQRLVPSQTWHLADQTLAGLVPASKGFVFRRGEGLPGRIWERGAPSWVINVSADPHFSRRDLFGEIGVKSAFGFPVFVEGRIEAVLEFFSAEEREPEPELILTVRSLSEQLGRVLERQRSLEQQKILLRELNHRIGNTLAIVGAIFRRTVASSTGKDELASRFEDRLMAISAAHQMLSDSNWTTTSLSHLIEETLRPYCADDRDNCSVSGPPVALTPRLTMTLNLVLHELATNAAKYGALSNPAGRVSISWEVDDLTTPLLTLRWLEEGGPPVGGGSRIGFGSELIKLMLGQNKGSHSSIDMAESGLRAEFMLPLGQAGGHSAGYPTIGVPNGTPQG